MLGSHSSLRWLSAATLSSPLTPSTMMLRASAMVEPASAIRAPGFDRATPCTPSAPARVFPNPPPAHPHPPPPAFVARGKLALVRPQLELPVEPQQPLR